MRDYSLEAPYGLINGCQTNKADNVSETQGSPLFEPDFTYSTTPSHSISPFLWPSPNDLFPFDYDGDFSNSTGLQVHDDYSQFDLPVFGNFSIMPAPFYDYEQFPLGDFQHIPEAYLPSLVLPSPSPSPSCEITYDTHLTALTPTSPIIPASIEIRSIQTQKPAERIGSTQIRSASSLRRRSGHKKLFYCPFEGCGSTMTSKINHQGHVDAHYGIKRWVCKACDKYYPQKSGLQRHRRMIHPTEGSTNLVPATVDIPPPFPDAVKRE